MKDVPASRAVRGAPALTRRVSVPAAKRGFPRIVGHSRTIGLLGRQQESARQAHAYCFVGNEGIGKTALGRALAEELVLGPGQPQRLDVHPDFWTDDRVEAVSIDEIRFHPEKGALAHDQSLQQFLSLKPFVARTRVALIANAERMTEAAQNCLLKTLEEPPPQTVLVLTTAYPDHLLPTCLSRCQVLAMSPVPTPALIAWLTELGATPDQAGALAGLAQGRPGWALRARNEAQWLAAFERWGEELAALAFEDVDGVLSYATRFGQGPQSEQRVIASQALQSFTAWLRDALLVQTGFPIVGSERRPTLLAQWSQRVSPAHLRASLASAQRTQLLIDQNVNPRLAMEVMLLDFRYSPAS